jgi:hypothetical protein
MCILKVDEDINVFWAYNKYSPVSGPYFYINYLSIFISVFVRQISFIQRRRVKMIVEGFMFTSYSFKYLQHCR